MARKTGSHAQTTGPRVRAAAEALIARQGFAAVSMRQIAAKVGVQVGALYRYTPDKQSLLFNLMQDHMAELLQAWAEEPLPTDPAGRLRAFCRFHIGFHLDRPDAVFIANMELRNLKPENFDKIEAVRRRYESILEDILSEGKSTGAFAFDDLRLTTMAILSMLTGVIGWYREGGRLSRSRTQQIYSDMVLRAVGAA